MSYQVVLIYSNNLRKPIWLEYNAKAIFLHSFGNQVAGPDLSPINTVQRIEMR